MLNPKIVSKPVIVVLSICFIFINSLSVFAQSDSQSQSLDVPGNNFVQRFDKNGDEKLARSEFPGLDVSWKFPVAYTFINCFIHFASIG